MAKSRMKTTTCILKGLLAGIAITLPAMLLLALAAVFCRISDGLLTTLNQILKAAAIITGVRMAVGRGGERGFITGAVVAMLYMILGYGLYVLLGGNAFETPVMLGEILIGAAVGSISGAVFANLPATKSSGRRRGA